LLTADVASDEPDLAALDGPRDDVSTLRRRLATTIAHDGRRDVQQRCAAYEAVLRPTRDICELMDTALTAGVG
jgi:hypothetical protein